MKIRGHLKRGVATRRGKIEKQQEIEKRLIGRSTPNQPVGVCVLEQVQSADYSEASSGRLRVFIPAHGELSGRFPIPAGVAGAGNRDPRSDPCLASESPGEFYTAPGAVSQRAGGKPERTDHPQDHADDRVLRACGVRAESGAAQERKGKNPWIPAPNAR